MQFAYGEDGIDVMNVSYLREFGFLSRNAERFAQQLNLQQALQASGLSRWEEEARSLTRYRCHPCIFSCTFFVFCRLGFVVTAEMSILAQQSANGNTGGKLSA